MNYRVIEPVLLREMMRGGPVVLRGTEAALSGLVPAGSGYCEARYKANSVKCRRIASPKGRALCWAAIMAIYANCRALMT